MIEKRMNIQRLLLLLRQDRRGVTAIEYGMIAAFIAVVIISGVKLLGSHLSSIFSTVATSV
jgi:pilus assembly protein Flp/PilA